jgi:glucokinase
MNVLIGIDIGGTKCAASLGMLDSEKKIAVLDKIIFATGDYPEPDLMIAELQHGIELLIARNNYNLNDIAGIGISCGGPLDSTRGIILSPPNLPGWIEVPIVKRFAERFHAPAIIQNDANACAFAEWKFGAGQGFDNMIFLTFGTGLGAGLILNGTLYSGANDMAGEVGHIRLENFGPVGYGKTGSFEGFCSGSGISQLAQIKIKEKLQQGHQVSFCKGIDDRDTITALDVAKAANSGDRAAWEIFNICGGYLGKGLSIMIDILNPQLIIIGGIFARSAELLMPAMEEVISKEALPQSLKACKIVPSALGDKIGDYAALSLAAVACKTI